MHGGAPGPALNMVFEIGAPERAETVIRAKLDRSERLMGFGHRVYRVRDPRADVLAQAAERFYSSGGDRRLYDLARTVEETALRLLRERKPDRRLDTNVEFYTALLLHGLGLPAELFAATFAVGRILGWAAHCLEQLREGRLIRPQSPRRPGRTSLRRRSHLCRALKRISRPEFRYSKTKAESPSGLRTLHVCKDRKENPDPERTTWGQSIPRTPRAACPCSCGFRSGCRGRSRACRTSRGGIRSGLESPSASSSRR